MYLTHYNIYILLLETMTTLMFEKEKLLADFMIDEKKLEIIQQDSQVLIEISDDEQASRIISMKAEQWKSFCDNIESIKLAITRYLVRARDGKFRLHLGKDKFISVESGYLCVDFRKWYASDEGELKPSRVGVALNIREFDTLCALLKDVNEEIPSFDAIIPCQYTHNDDTKCEDCTPSATFKKPYL